MDRLCAKWARGWLKPDWMRLLAAGAEGEQDGRGRLSLWIGFWDQLNFWQDGGGDFWLSLEMALGPVFVLDRGWGNPSLLKGFWRPVDFFLHEGTFTFVRVLGTRWTLCKVGNCHFECTFGCGRGAWTKDLPHIVYSKISLDWLCKPLYVSKEMLKKVHFFNGCGAGERPAVII